MRQREGLALQGVLAVGWWRWPAVVTYLLGHVPMHRRDSEIGLSHFLRKPVHLTLSVVEDDCLRNSQRVVQVAQRVEFPLFAFDRDKELFYALQCQLCDGEADWKYTKQALMQPNRARQVHAGQVAQVAKYGPPPSLCLLPTTLTTTRVLPAPLGFAHGRLQREAREQTVLKYRSHPPSRFTSTRMGSVMNFVVISRISCGRVAESNTTWVPGGRYLQEGAPSG